MTSSEPAVSAATKTPVRAAVLCVDDEISILKSLQRLLMAAGFDVVTATGGEQGLLLLEKQEFAVISAICVCQA